jgi:hypothetical protein
VHCVLRVMKTWILYYCLAHLQDDVRGGEERSLEKESRARRGRLLLKGNVLRPDPLREVTSDAACSEYLLAAASLYCIL